MEGPFNLAIYLMKLDFRITTKISPVRCAVFTCSVMSDSATLWTVARQAPLFMGILQARILEWVAISFSIWWIYVILNLSNTIECTQFNEP